MGFCLFPFLGIRLGITLKALGRKWRDSCKEWNQPTKITDPQVNGRWKAISMCRRNVSTTGKLRAVVCPSGWLVASSALAGCPAPCCKLPTLCFDSLLCPVLSLPEQGLQFSHQGHLVPETFTDPATLMNMHLMEIKDVRKGHLSTVLPYLTTASFILSSAASF